MHHCAIEDPSNVVILNVNGLELQEVNMRIFFLEYFEQNKFRLKKMIFYYLIILYELMQMKINYHFVCR
jgi:hypothetical protein